MIWGEGGANPTPTRKKQAGNCTQLRVTSGENTNNEEIGAADRPELFQEADAAEAREVLAERGTACARTDLDRVDWCCAGFEGVFKRAHERGARSAGGAVRGVPCPDGRRVFGEGQR